MSLRSMTGFARVEGSHEGQPFFWELRSVNGRGLDVRMRLPSGYDALEPMVREAVAARLVRGNVSVHLTVTGGAGGGDLRVNERALATILAAIDQLSKSDVFDRPRPEGVLGLRGVLETVDGAAEMVVDDARRASLRAALDRAVEGLVAARAEEGGRLQVVLSSALDRIEVLVGQIRGTPSRQPERIAARLSEQVNRLVGADAGIDPARLHQEALLLATRADVEEELDRLTAHVDGARVLFNGGEAAGRRLDFLGQEFNREANTICSKSNDVEITRLGLELKAVVDQLREQVQNIE